MSGDSVGPTIRRAQGGQGSPRKAKGEYMGSLDFTPPSALHLYATIRLRPPSHMSMLSMLRTKAHHPLVARYAPFAGRVKLFPRRVHDGESERPAREDL